MGRFVGIAICGAMIGCAAGGDPSDGGGGRFDAETIDGGTTDAGALPMEDGGRPDFDAGLNLMNGDTCDPCADMGDCQDGYYCAALTSGGSACLPACNIDLPDCAPRFSCVMNFNETTLPEPICAPVGERCCVDADEDLHGQGVGCLGADCDEGDATINDSATEACNGSDDDCDTRIDEGDADALCPRGPHVAESACASGACENRVCEPGFGDCDGDPLNGCEQQTNTDMHCGGCNVGCDPPNATGTCTTGTCDIAMCDAGFGDCDGDPTNGCELPLNSLTDCGRCGVSCGPPGAIGDCSTGTCQIGMCNPRRADCDASPINGCETETTTNADCGGCGVLCAPRNAVGECSTGACRIVSCTRSDFDDCDGIDSNGCETSLRTNTNCSGCGVACSIPGGMSSCASGSCQLTGCAMGLGDCDAVAGCEQMLNTNTHCGDCRVPCAPANATGSCSTGTCRVVTCNAGWGNCDGNHANGCEAPLNTLTNCGTCGTACALNNATETCGSYSCRIENCNVGYAQCNTNHADGCETNIRTNTNCGACGVSCSRPNASASCSTGVCNFGTCNSGYSTCDANTTNGCEVNHRTTVAACGGGSDAGQYDGDLNCGFGCPGNTSWDNFETFTGTSDRWFQGRVYEDSDCNTSIQHRVRLAVPSGVDYDLYVYRGGTCGTLAGSSTNRGTGTDESVTFTDADDYFSDDSFDYFVHVRWVSGASCTAYSLYFDGHNC
jgi:hypothetical protein